MKSYHRRQTTRLGVTARSPTMVKLHDTQFVQCRWWNDGWTVKTVVTWSSTSTIPAPEVRTFCPRMSIQRSLSHMTVGAYTPSPWLKRSWLVNMLLLTLFRNNYINTLRCLLMFFSCHTGPRHADVQERKSVYILTSDGKLASKARLFRLFSF